MFIRIVTIILFPYLCVFFSCEGKTNKHPKGEKVGLKVSRDGHFLMKDGKPFFWMGDTGWFLFTQSPEDVDYFFKDRSVNGFNAIQMMVTRRMFNEGDFTPNYRGDLPFESLTPVKLNENYYAHIDTIVKKAGEYGLVLAMAPTWGWNLDQMFSKEKPEEAYKWGHMLGERYKDCKNVIWIVCGEYHKIAWDIERKKPDSNPDSLELNLIENLARGLEAGHKGANLMTIHPDGWLSSSDHFHDATWLDFNMVQTFNIGVGTEYIILNDYKRMPYKPTLLAEPGYENKNEDYRAFESRYDGYHSVLSGGFGYTYGCEGVWNFKEGWKSLFNSEGNIQMKYLRRLFESRPMLHRIPTPELIKGCLGDWVEKTKLAAARDDSGAYAFIYFPNDTIQAEIRVSEISGKKANAWWYNPRDGETYDANGEKTEQPFSQLACNLHQTNVFDPPGDEGYGHDWVLILDDSDRKLKKP